MAGRDYTLFAELNPPFAAGGPVNCVLFIRGATLLVSGGGAIYQVTHRLVDLPAPGDDQIVRLWDVESGGCLQELRDPRWGQITALSWLPEEPENSAVLFIGTGRGVVSTYPFSNERTRLIRQASSTIAAFRLDDSVEVQALDSSHLKFVVGSHSGEIQMFGIKDTTTLYPLWNIHVGDIPRSVLFHGDQGEHLITHTCCLGKVVYSNSNTGDGIGTVTLGGGIGSAALSADGGMKAVYNLSSGNFDVYQPADSVTPVVLPLPPGTRLIKQCVFAEEGHTLVCGGDDGTIHVFQLGEVSQRRSLSAEEVTGPDSFYAVTAFSTDDYHYIAGGENEEPASIFIWRKTTEKRAAEIRRLKRLQADKEIQAAEKEKETRALKEQLATMEEMLSRTRNQSNNIWLLGGLLVLGMMLFGLAYRRVGRLWAKRRNNGADNRRRGGLVWEMERENIRGFATHVHENKDRSTSWSVMRTSRSADAMEVPEESKASDPTDYGWSAHPENADSKTPFEGDPFVGYPVVSDVKGFAYNYYMYLIRSKNGRDLHIQTKPTRIYSAQRWAQGRCRQDAAALPETMPTPVRHEARAVTSRLRSHLLLTSAGVAVTVHEEADNGEGIAVV
ncbi:quinon protein alcohol dehydrogenase-like superfamily [Mycena filopes]|nr:quinon protein alcohol dehydrogenase-like superfamily [Mycena filopes]